MPAAYERVFDLLVADLNATNLAHCGPRVAWSGTGGKQEGSEREGITSLLVQASWIFDPKNWEAEAGDTQLTTDKARQRKGLGDSLRLSRGSAIDAPAASYDESCPPPARERRPFLPPFRCADQLILG